MLQDVTQFCSEDFSADIFVALVSQWLQHPASDQGEIRAQILEQEHLAQKQALLSTSLEFQEWLKKAHHHGLRGLFRSLRQRDQAWQRPFQDLPALERIIARERQWGDIWHPLPAQALIRGLDQLRDLAQQEALTWKPIDSSVLQKLLRRLPNKAAGPDGVSYDMLRHRSPLAHSDDLHQHRSHPQECQGRAAHCPYLLPVQGLELLQEA